MAAGVVRVGWPGRSGWIKGSRRGRGWCWKGRGVEGARCGWGDVMAGGWLEGSSYLLPDVVIVGGQTPCFAEVAYHTCSVVYVPGC